MRPKIKIASNLALIISSLFLLGPILLALLLAVTPPDMIVLNKIVPQSITLGNFFAAWTRGNAPQCVLNSLIVGLGSACAGIALGFPAAYMLARTTFPMKSWILGALLLLRLHPKMPAMAGYYRMISEMGLIDNLFSVTLVRGGGIIMAIWLMKASIERISINLERAAMLDGFPRWKAILFVTGRLASPGIAAAFLLEFVASWNSFLLPLLFLERPDSATVALGIDRFLSGNALEYGTVMAFALLVSAPLLVVLPGILSRTLAPYEHRLSSEAIWKK